MLFLAHLGFTLIITDTIRSMMNKDKFSLLELVSIGIGSLLPDILDKLFFYYVFQSGRTLAHSILFNIAILSLFYIIRDVKVILLSFASFLHLVLDSSGYLPLFWPITPIKQSKDLIYSFIQAYTNLNNVIIEIIGLIAVTFVVIAYKDQIEGGLNQVAQTTYLSRLW